MIPDLLQPTHLIVVLAVALLVLGPKRLPGAGRAVGQGLREFKQSLTGVYDDQAALQPTNADADEIPSA